MWSFIEYSCLCLKDSPIFLIVLTTIYPFILSIQKNLLDACIYVCLSIYADSSIETEFSGTTFTCAVIRDNFCVCGNIGDSRTVIGFKNSTDGITADSLTIDHKPDLPAEKVISS